MNELQRIKYEALRKSFISADIALGFSRAEYGLSDAIVKHVARQCVNEAVKQVKALVLGMKKPAEAGQ